MWRKFIHTFGWILIDLVKIHTKVLFTYRIIESLLALSIACVRLLTSNFSKRFEECVFMVFRETNKRDAISWLLKPSAISCNTSISRLLRFSLLISSWFKMNWSGGLRKISFSTITVFIFGLVNFNASQIPNPVNSMAMAPIYISKAWLIITNLSSSHLSTKSRMAKAEP